MTVTLKSGRGRHGQPAGLGRASNPSAPPVSNDEKAAGAQGPGGIGGGRAYF